MSFIIVKIGLVLDVLTDLASLFELLDKVRTTLVKTVEEVF